MRVGYLGPEGTVSHDALLSAPGSFEPVPLPTLHTAVLAVHDGSVDRALVPIENALEGSVNPTLDALVFEATDVAIVGELRHPVHFCLIAGGPLELSEVRTIVSIPQASGQCARFLRESLPRARVVTAPSTADAVRQIAGGVDGGAALGTRRAAERYGGTILRENVEDHPDNETRFVWLARGTSAPAPATSAPAPATSAPTPADPSARHKTALVFWGSGSAGPGWLVRCLSEFAERDVNLTRIESRPLRQRLGEYMFFLDLEGAIDEAEVASAVAALRSHADVVRVLGSFPAA
jgi:prephenate dehydratase